MSLDTIASRLCEEFPVSDLERNAAIAAAGLIFGTLESSRLPWPISASPGLVAAGSALYLAKLGLIYHLIDSEGDNIEHKDNTSLYHAHGSFMMSAHPLMKAVATKVKVVTMNYENPAETFSKVNPRELVAFKVPSRRLQRGEKSNAYFAIDRESRFRVNISSRGYNDPESNIFQRHKRIVWNGPIVVGKAFFNQWGGSIEMNYMCSQ